MQGTRVRSLVQEDPTCCRATKPMHHNYWGCALEPASHNCWAHALQLLKPTPSKAHVPQLLSPHAATTEAHVPRVCAPQQETTTAMRSPCIATKSSPHSPQLEKARVQQRRPRCSQKQKKNYSCHYYLIFLYNDLLFALFPLLALGKCLYLYEFLIHWNLTCSFL